MNTPEGGFKISATVRARMTDVEYRQMVIERGRRGGSAKVPKGFAITGKAVEAGQKGGSASRHRKSAPA